jgi:cell fate (sporulation/competence/biofilm development) regulator YlbF (YheA/YmcA/DUF963 family)
VLFAKNRGIVNVEVFFLIATIERVQILEEAEQISSMILQSELAEEYRSCLYKVQRDREAQRLISDFQKMKEKYDEVQRFGKYHPDFRTVSKETRELKRKLDLHDTIAAFKQAEDDIQKVLDEISVQLGGAVSKHIKVPTGNPYFDSISSCGGGCGSGGSCGCG